LTRPRHNGIIGSPTEPTPSLEALLLQNALHGGSVEGATVDWNKGKDWAGRHSSWLWAAIFLIVGGYIFHRWPALSFPHDVGEFLLLAGALTITVDPYLKRKLQKEAAEDIFQHLLGISLPVGIPMKVIGVPG
jgi:hypothetical protein